MRAALALTMMMLLAAPAAGQDLEQAKAYFEAGKQAYEAREYLAAATAFQEAYEQSKKPALLFSTAQAYRLHFLMERNPQSLQSAVDLYRRYLTEASTGSRRTDAAELLASLEVQLNQLPAGDREALKVADDRPTQVMIASRTEGALVSLDGADPSPVPLVRTATPGVHLVEVKKPGYFSETLQLVAVEGRLVVAQVNLQPLPAKLTVTAPTGAEVLLDGRRLGQAPLGTIDLESGRRLVSVSARGRHSVAQEVVLEGGKETYLKVELHDTGQRTMSYWILGGGGLVFTAAAVTGTLALLNDASARIYLTRRDIGDEVLTREELDTYRKARSKATDFKRAFWSTLIVSGALTSVGAALYFFDSPNSAGPGLLSVTPALGPDGAYVSGELRF